MHGSGCLGGLEHLRINDLVGQAGDRSQCGLRPNGGAHRFVQWARLRGLDDEALGFKYQDASDPSTVFDGPQLVAARQAMNKAYDGMVAKYGRIDVPLGDLRKVSRGSFTGPVDGGDFDVPALRLAHCKGQPGSASPVAYQPCVAAGGSSFTFDIDMGDPTVLRYNRPISNTDSSTSPFISKNTEDFSSGTFRVLPVTAEQASRDRDSLVTLPVPGTRPKGFKLLTLRVRTGRLGRNGLRFWCPKSQPAAGEVTVTDGCEGWFKARVAFRARKRAGKSRKFSVLVGFRRLDLKPGMNQVGFKLNRKGRRLLKERGILKASLTMKLNLLGDHAWTGGRMTFRKDR